MISTFLRAVMSAASLSSQAREPASRATSAGSTTTSASVSSASSRSSGFVNAACAGPRRPSTTTSSISLSASAAIAWSDLGAGDDLDVPARRDVGGVALQPGPRAGVEGDVGGVDDDVRVGELGELAQLGVRERGLRRAAAAEHDDLLDLALGQRGDRMV